jgi:lipid-binding SYLF domain-containing protein
MKKLTSIVVGVVALGLALMPILGCGAQEPEETIKETAEAVEESVEQTMEEVEEYVAEEPATEASAEEPEWKSMKHEAKAAKIDETADEALQELFAERAKAKDLFSMSYGWAVFDNLKLALGLSGGGGNGVAVNRQTGERTYMKMGTGGVGLGLGVNKYQVVFLMEDQQTFDNFVEKGWQADAGATAAAGTSAAEVKTDFVNGLAIYQLTEKGLMLNADIAGTKYWKNKKLND